MSSCQCKCMIKIFECITLTIMHVTLKIMHVTLKVMHVTLKLMDVTFCSSKCELPKMVQTSQACQQPCHRQARHKKVLPPTHQPSFIESNIGKCIMQQTFIHLSWEGGIRHAIDNIIECHQQPSLIMGDALYTCYI